MNYSGLLADVFYVTFLKKLLYFFVKSSLSKSDFPFQNRENGFSERFFDSHI